MAPGVFVTVGGVDGAGKSTLVAALCDRAAGCLRRPVVSVAPLKTTEPKLVAEVRALWLAGSAQSAQREHWLAGYFTFRLARAAAAVIRPTLASGGLVIADRWITDHQINQNYFGSDLADWAGLIATLPRPDLSVIVDVPVAVSQQRIAARGVPGVGAGEAFLGYARAAYADAPGDYLRIDGLRPTADSVERVWARLGPAVAP